MNQIIISFLDLETTGLKQEEGHRIIELAFLLFSYDLNTHEKKAIGKYVQRVNPNRSIDAKAQAVHHIAINDLMGEPTWEEVVDKVVKVLIKTDLLVAHNINFDAPFIANEILRVGRKLPECETFCTMDEGRFASFDGFPPSLRKLADCFDIKYDLTKAHSALYDISLTAQCFFLGLERGYYQLPTNFNQLEDAA